MAYQIQHKEKCIVKKNKSRGFLQNRNMFSKFLYYSSCKGGDEDQVPSTSTGQCSGSILPDTPSQSDQPEFQRTTYWTFEDIRMLVGTDLPIFGGGTRPCVSLKLRDMNKPINVLTGLDYWLDNLMCNVPELAMCYHQDGIVQYYDLVETEDIPNMEGSQFSPQVVKDIAQNILSFLKSRATKEGHTYWLFKSSEDDIIKLYDLTTLCAGYLDDGDSVNPFSVPVGVLLYRVARNMRSRPESRDKTGVIRTLLENSLKLLTHKTHAQIVTSAHYLLSDLYVTDDLLFSSPHTLRKTRDSGGTEDPDKAHSTSDKQLKDNAKFLNTRNSSKNDVLTSDEETEPDGLTTVDVKTLCEAESMKSDEKQVVRYPPISGDNLERCQQALQHIAQGLQCIDCSIEEEAVTESKHQTDQQEQCNPTQPIPLHYQRLTDPTQPHPHLASDVLPRRPHRWQDTSRLLLLLKATKAYLCLAECRVTHTACLGESLRYIYLALQSYYCGKSVDESKGDKILEIVSRLYRLCGDVLVSLSPQSLENLTQQLSDFTSLSTHDKIIQQSITELVTESEGEMKWLQKLNTCSETMLRQSVKCYRSALKLYPNSNSHTIFLKKRLANSLNVFSVFLMNKGSSQHTNAGVENSRSCDSAWTESLECFSQGIEIFESIGDKVNVALLHGNKGRLMRMWANSCETLTSGKREFSLKEKHFLLKAAECYIKGRELLKKREGNAEVWDAITWDLSTVYFTMATLLQDCPPLSRLSQCEIEKEVTEWMDKALKYCDTETDSSRLPTCQYRAGSIHFRLASLYHNAYRKQESSEAKKKHLKKLSDLHYMNAAGFYAMLDCGSDLLRVRLEQVALSEYQLNNQTSMAARVKSLQSALTYLLQTEACLRNMATHLKEEHTSHPIHHDSKSLTAIFMSRLKFILLNLVKHYSQTKKGKSSEDSQKQLEVFKALYRLVLEKSEEQVTASNLTNTCQHLADLVQTLNIRYGQQS